jgi:DNA-binding MarR family transcriptional regulator
MPGETKPDVGHIDLRRAASPAGGIDPSSTEARIGFAWRELRRGASAQAMRERLYGDLLEPAQVDALDVVVASGGCRMAELADALRVDRSTATRLVDRLVRAGVVDRRETTGDGRGVLVVTTPRGEALFEEFSTRRRAMLYAVLDDFDDGDRRHLADLLERLVAGIDHFTDRRGG